MTYKPLIDRFMEKVEVTEGCWEWRASARSAGYGGFRIDGRTFYAHRVAYEIFVGPLEGRHLHHTCENRGCVNPEHLEVVDLAAHTSLHRQRIEVCKEGHPLVIRHTWKTPQKFCPTCMNEASRRYRERRKAKA